MSQKPITLSIDISELEARVQEVNTMAVNLKQLWKKYENFTEQQKEIIKEAIAEYSQPLESIIKEFKSEIRYSLTQTRRINKNLTEVSQTLSSKTIELVKLKAELQQLRKEKKEINSLGEL